MERLTKKSDQKGRGYVSAIGSGVGTWNKIITRLAEYENTGMSPEEMMERIKRFPQVIVEQDGKFFVATENLAKAFGCPQVATAKGCDEMTCKECWECWLRRDNNATD